MKLRGKVSFRASMRQTGKVTAARDGWRGCAAGREFYGPQKIQFPAFIWEFRIGPLTRKEVSHNRLANGLSALCHGQRGLLLFVSTISWIWRALLSWIGLAQAFKSFRTILIDLHLQLSSCCSEM
jgi:hypothetical protein